MDALRKKTRRQNGESLIETLAALLIACLAFIMLPGAIVTAARVNAQAEKQFLHIDGTAPDDEAATTDEKMDGKVVVNGNESTVTIIKDTSSADKNGTFYYYFPDKSEENEESDEEDTDED